MAGNDIAEPEMRLNLVELPHGSVALPLAQVSEDHLQDVDLKQKQTNVRR